MEHKARSKILLSICFVAILVSGMFFFQPVMYLNGHFIPVIQVQEIINSSLLALMFKIPFQIPGFINSYWQIYDLHALALCYLISLVFTLVLLFDSITGMFHRPTRFILGLLVCGALAYGAFLMYTSKETILRFASDKFADPGEYQKLYETLFKNTEINMSVMAYVTISGGCLLFSVFNTTFEAAEGLYYKHLRKLGIVPEGEEEYDPNQVTGSGLPLDSITFLGRLRYFIGPSDFYIRIEMCQVDNLIKSIIFAIGRFFKALALWLYMLLFKLTRPIVYYAIEIHEINKLLFKNIYRHVLYPVATFTSFTLRAFFQYLYFSLSCLITSLFKLVFNITKVAILIVPYTLIYVYRFFVYFFTVGIFRIGRGVKKASKATVKESKTICLSVGKGLSIAAQHTYLFLFKITRPFVYYAIEIHEINKLFLISIYRGLVNLANALLILMQYTLLTIVSFIELIFKVIIYIIKVALLAPIYIIKFVSCLVIKLFKYLFIGFKYFFYVLFVIISSILKVIISIITKIIIFIPETLYINIKFDEKKKDK